MPTLEETLKRLAVSFTVRDIMIPVEDLVCVTDEYEAAAVSTAYPDYNVIPIRHDGKFTEQYKRAGVQLDGHLIKRACTGSRMR